MVRKKNKKGKDKGNKNKIVCPNCNGKRYLPRTTTDFDEHRVPCPLCNNKENKQHILPLEGGSGIGEDYLSFKEDNSNQILMDKIVDFWNYYIDKGCSQEGFNKEQEEMARYIHRIQGILAIRELKKNGDKLFK